MKKVSQILTITHQSASDNTLTIVEHGWHTVLHGQVCDSPPLPEEKPVGRDKNCRISLRLQCGKTALDFILRARLERRNSYF